MKVKRVKIGIKSLKDVLDNFARTCEAIERGEKVKKQRGIYFESAEAFRKALTTKRFELIQLIKKHRPQNLHELARFAERDVKNVSQDVEMLKNLGLVTVKQEKTGRKEVSPTVDYDAIELLIAV